jgi:hypothetical protein
MSEVDDIVQKQAKKNHTQESVKQRRTFLEEEHGWFESTHGQQIRGLSSGKGTVVDRDSQLTGAGHDFHNSGQTNYHLGPERGVKCP